MSRLAATKDKVYRKTVIKRAKEIRKHLMRSGKDVQWLNDIPLIELVNNIFRTADLERMLLYSCIAFAFWIILNI
jgi:hypothetical protein